MVKWLRRLAWWRGERAKYLATQEALDVPWACFEIVAFEDDGQVKVDFNWNDAFIKKINSHGFQAETEQDSVQLFFYTAQMRPTQISNMGGDQTVQSENHPGMSDPANRVVG